MRRTARTILPAAPAALLLLLLLFLLPSAHADGILSTAEDFRGAFAAHAGRGETEFTVTFTPGLFDAVRSGTLLSDVHLNSGVSRLSYIYRERAGSVDVTFHDLVYYPGARILRAARSGDTASLTARERETLSAALTLAPTLGTEAERERIIHDTLCRWITYTRDSGEPGAAPAENDTAVGALLNRQADCDGYADAFFLLCGLSGLEAGYVHGTTVNSDDSNGHMWNTVRVGGQRVMVDVTWDDTGTDASPFTLYYNIGTDQMARDHFWNPAALEAGIRADTDSALRGTAPAFVFAADWPSLGSVIRTQAAARPDRICISVPASVRPEADTQRLSTLLHASGLESFHWNLAPDRFELCDIVYCAAFGHFESEQTAVAFIDSLEAAGIRKGTVRLSFTDSLGKRLFAGEREGLNDLLARSSLALPADWVYYDGAWYIDIRDPLFVHLSAVTDAASLRAFMQSAMASRPSEVDLRLGGGMSLTNDIRLICDIARGLGATGQISYYHWGETRIRLHGLVYENAFSLTGIASVEAAVDFINGLEAFAPISGTVHLGFDESLGRRLFADERAGISDLLGRTSLALPADWTYNENALCIDIADPGFVCLPPVTDAASLRAFLRTATASRPSEVDLRLGGGMSLTNDIRLICDTARSLGVTGQISYYHWGETRILLRDLTYEPVFLLADSRSDILPFLQKCRAGGVTSFCVFCTAADYAALAADNASGFFALLSQSGYSRYTLWHNDAYLEFIVEAVP